MKWYFIVVLTWISPIMSYVEWGIFSWAFWPYVCFLWRNTYLDLLPIFWLGWFFWILSCMNYLHILEIKSLLVCFMWRNTYLDLLPIFWLGWFFWILSCMNYLHILEIKSLSVTLLQIFSPQVCSFLSLSSVWKPSCRWDSSSTSLTKVGSSCNPPAQLLLSTTVFITN